MMKKSKIIMMSIAGLAVILPLAMFYSMSPVVSQTHSLVESLTVDDLTDRAMIIVEGKIVKSTTGLQYYGGDTDTPKVYTKWYLEPTKFIKGSDKSPLLEIKTFGGTHEKYTQTTDDVSFNIGEKVILFLGKEPESIYSDSYYVRGLQQGKYSVEDSMVKSEIPGRDSSEQELLKKVATRMNQ